MKKLLGELLVKAELVTQEELETALAEQPRAAMRIGQVLVQKKLLKEEQLTSILSKQLRVPRLKIDESFEVSEDMKDVIPLELVRKHHVAPVMKKGSLLQVATTDPTDLHTFDTLEKALGMEVEPVLCEAAELNNIVSQLYGVRLFEDGALYEFSEIDIEAEPDKAAQEQHLNVQSLQSLAEESPVVKIVNAILIQAFKSRASDVHIRPKERGVELKYRIDGKLFDFPAPPRNMHLPIVSRVKLLSGLDISISRIPQDGRFTYRAMDQEVSVRTSTAPTIYGEKVVMRMHFHDQKELSLEELGMAEEQRNILKGALRKPYGMILATGPTGSGKTTLLYALLRKICNPEINIVTLEDPVESKLEDITQIQLNPKAGMTFASGLRAILRQDPDVIMVGEIRDLETASIAVQASMTGHKVFSTLHTNDSAGAVSRFIEMGIEPFLIATNILVVVAQRLVRRLCPHCLEPYRITKEQALALDLKDDIPASYFNMFRAVGCNKCDFHHYTGRIGVFEVLRLDRKMQSMIIRRASTFELQEAAKLSREFRSLKNDASIKLLQGITTFEEYLTLAD